MTWTLLTKEKGTLGVKGETLFLPMLYLDLTRKEREDENSWCKDETLPLVMLDLDLTNKAGEEKTFRIKVRLYSC